MASANYELWQNGSMLSKAWKLHCDEAVRKNIEQIGVEVLEAFGQSPAANAIGGLLSAFGPNQSFERMKRLMGQLSEAREEIVVDLYNEDLVGIGQAGLGTTSRRFEIIPAEFWYDALPDWQSDTARTRDREFIRIRVIDPSKYPQLKQKRGPGRPGVQDRLFEAIDFIERGKILDVKTATHKEIILEILNYYRNKNTDDYKALEGLDLSTFRKAITAYRDR